MDPYCPNAGSSKIAGLNGLPSEYEMALQQQRANGFDDRGAYDFQADLDMFTNTQFFDFDMAEVPETNSPNASEGDIWGINNGFVAGQSNQQQPQNFNAYNTQTQPHPYPVYPTATASSTTSTIASPTTAGPDSKARNSSSTNDKFITSTTASIIGDDAREAAEEDKRRRNTAASARFRVKKKQREQALEKTSKEMTERVSYLEQRVQTLEMENKLLKDLITEKNGVVPDLGEEVEEFVGKASASSSRRDVPAKRKEVKIETKGIS